MAQGEMDGMISIDTERSPIKATRYNGYNSLTVSADPFDRVPSTPSLSSQSSADGTNHQASPVVKFRYVKRLHTANMCVVSFRKDSVAEPMCSSVDGFHTSSPMYDEFDSAHDSLDYMPIVSHKFLQADAKLYLRCLALHCRLSPFCWQLC